MFASIAAAPPDPILGLSEEFQKDTRSHKINLTIGVYRDAQGQTPVLECVKRAEKHLLESEKSKSYLGIDGLPEFRRLAAELVMGGPDLLSRIATTQTPGGTGALKVAADFIARHAPSARVWCSTPTWPNHISVFESAGLTTLSYPYLGDNRRTLNLTAMLDTLGQEGREGDFVCLHACCHNPSGIDPSPAEWQQIAELTATRGLIPLVDFAYQGFGDGLEEDRLGLNELLKRHQQLLVSSSFSKNFGLYSERVGALLAVCPASDAAERVASTIKQIVRSNYSNPPRHGGAIVATILGDSELKSLWLDELAAMRQRIHAMRAEFVKGMHATGCETDFSFLLEQRGMFSFSGLTPMQVDWLRKEKGIYMIGSGRINVAGITPGNLGALTQGIAEALEA